MRKQKIKYSVMNMTARLLRIASPVKGRLVVSTLASIFGNLGQMALMGFGALTLLSAGGVLNIGSPSLFGALTAIFALIIVICRYIEGFVSHAGSYSLLSYMRIDLFNKIRSLAPAYLIDREEGDILNIAVSDIETIEFFFAHTIGPLFTVILLPCATLILAWFVHPLFAAALLPVYAVVSVLFPLIAIKAGRKTGMRYRARLGRLKSLILESVYGIRDIQIFGFGKSRLQAVREQNRLINSAAHGLTLHKHMVSAAPAFFVYLARILILASASYLAVKNWQNTAGVIFLSFVASASFSSTQSLTMVVSSLLEAYAAAERLFTIEDAKPETQEPENPREIGKIREIEFENVSFSYGDGRMILSDFCLKIKGNEKIGIQGESGIGKSTILRLLLRFWDTSGGRVLINGIPVTEVSTDELRRRIAVLEQDTFIFSGTIAENIALGKPMADISEIKLAAARSGIAEFIETLPDGYQTQMGQMGLRLSGGEKQRIGIARTLIVNPDVIVMDEPTSSLDVLHEMELLKTLRENCADKMLIIVSHRPSTLADCDRIIHLA